MNYLDVYAVVHRHNVEAHSKRVVLVSDNFYFNDQSESPLDTLQLVNCSIFR